MSLSAWLRPRHAAGTQGVFFDTSLARDDDGIRFENATVGLLLKHLHWRQDTQGAEAAPRWGAAQFPEARRGVWVGRAAHWLGQLVA